MAKYKIEHDRQNCIGCSACAGIDENFWKMDEGDGKSNLVDSKKRDDGWEERDIEEADFPKNKEAADACPVNVIHIKNLENDEKII